MITIKLKDNSKQAKTVLEMLKTFSFVEIIPNVVSTPKTSSKKNTASKVLQDLDLSFKQLTIAKKSNSKRKTLDDLLDGKQNCNTTYF